MPTKHSTNIGKHNDKILLKHIVSCNRDLPLSSIGHLIDYKHQDSKGLPIKREKVQNRLEYLKRLQKENYDTFAELCLTNLVGV